jgi:hypothetical protein
MVPLNYPVFAIQSSPNWCSVRGSHWMRSCEGINYPACWLYSSIFHGIGWIPMQHRGSLKMPWYSLDVKEPEREWSHSPQIIASGGHLESRQACQEICQKNYSSGKLCYCSGRRYCSGLRDCWCQKCWERGIPDNWSRIPCLSDHSGLSIAMKRHRMRGAIVSCHEGCPPPPNRKNTAEIIISWISHPIKHTPTTCKAY